MTLERSGTEEDGGSPPSPPAQESAFRKAAREFTPMWFSWCMNSGILAILTHNLPYQFNGLQQISTILFMIDLVVFTGSSLMFLLRLIWFGKTAYSEITGDFAQLTLLAMWPISWTTLSAFVALTVSQSYWGGQWAVILAYIMWWIGLFWTHAVLLFVLLLIIRQRREKDERLPLTIMIPTVGVLTDATVGGLISSMSRDISPRMSVPVILVSFMLVGAGLLFAILLYANLLHDLFTKGWIAPALTPTIFILVGPMGQAATALQANAASASTYMNFAHYDKGDFLTGQSASVVGATCTLLALLLAGAGSVMLLVALGDVIEKIVQKRLPWSPLWNAIIFPSGTLVSAMMDLSIAMDSPAFRVLAAIGVVSLFIVYLVNLVFTMYRVSTRRLIPITDDVIKRA